jgi:hypothetical protein
MTRWSGTLAIARIYTLFVGRTKFTNLLQTADMAIGGAGTWGERRWNE